ncbi:putative cwf19-like protein [Helianthus annuus]|nr:putative cwf19-like protein [Helianthus annuus]
MDTERDSKKGTPDRHHTKMRMPRPDDFLFWGKRKNQNMSVKDAGVVSYALSSMQKFTNDGSFMQQFKSQQQQQEKQNDDSCTDRNTHIMPDVSKSKEPLSSTADVKPALSANQLAAKAMQLRLKGKHDEADKLLKRKADTTNRTISEGDVTTSRYIMHGLKTREKKKEEDADMHVARSIMQNRKFSISGQADDEYDYDDGPKKKKRGKGDNGAPKSTGNTRFEKGILTQKERCNFCFENPKRPRHLVVAIANFTYLMLPPWQPVVPGHCCILPMQHELATRSVDDNVWDEIRNFKKCLLMMFAKQEKEVVFLETVMGLAKQSRHCMIECIPLPPDGGKQAALYFKKPLSFSGLTPPTPSFLLRLFFTQTHLTCFHLPQLNGRPPPDGGGVRRRGDENRERGEIAEREVTGNRGGRGVSTVPAAHDSGYSGTEAVPLFFGNEKPQQQQLTAALDQAKTTAMAIDEAEDEWSQHNAKKLIDTSVKGLRHSIPEDFPYFHVEFGLKKGFVHVIDDESQFKSNFGVNVIRGMLQLPAEDMHRRNKYDSIDTQKEAVANFTRDWEPFDWTKQLDYK